MHLRSIRKQLGLSQREMAEMLSISRSKLSHVEMGLSGLPAPMWNYLQTLVKCLEEDMIVPEEVHQKFEKQEQKAQRQLDWVIYNKELELKNAKQELEEMQSQHVSAYKALQIMCLEKEIFQGMTHDFESLDKMYAKALKTYLATTPKQQLLVKCKIAAAQGFLDVYKGEA